MFTWECDAFSLDAAYEGASMSKHHGTQTLNFENFSGYYGSVQSGYGGFVWSDVDFMSSSYWQDSKTNWCDTGYQNVLDGNGLAFSRFGGAGYYTQQGTYTPSFGYFRPENIKETFSLVSMVAASAWETNQPFKFTAYVYDPGVGFLKKGSVTLHIGQTAQTIDFEHLSSPTILSHTFDNISAVRITSGSGSIGNTCSYGSGQPTYGNELAFDDLKIKWNGGVPHGVGGAVRHPLLGHHQVAPAAHLPNLHALSHATEGASSHHAASGYHAELMSLHDSSGLTSLFHLPSAEHFGT